MKKRPSFLCWQCERAFGQVVDMEGDPVLLLKCPYCGAECKVDLAPYRQSVVEVVRDKKAGPSSIRYELPDKIKTTGPEDEAPT